jgi:uncharacterized membrane protein
MHPLIRVTLAVVGSALGALLAGKDIVLLAAVVGALAGIAIGEVASLRKSLRSLEEELRGLREAILRRPADAAPKAPPAPSESAPLPSVRPDSQPMASTPGTSPASIPVTWKFRDNETPPEVENDNVIIRLLREYFTGGNTLVRSGVVVLFFGVAFLLRYLAEHSHLPIELRLSGVACSALVLLVIGWRLRSKRPGYALALQGGALGVLYLTVFSALRLYLLLSPAAAFALLAALSALCAILAILQDSMAVALLAVTGGFLAPFLASTGTGDHVTLFSYFIVLNAAIACIAWFRSWRLLNLAGFAFTFALGTFWGVLQYRSQYFASTEPFLVIFFLLYVAIAVLYSTRQAPALHDYIDGTIIFGTPIAAFGLQATMLDDQRLSMAYSALAVSALYLALAWLLFRRRGVQHRLLVEAFMALGIAFLTLAVPLALNGRWSAASWALEGAALIWVGCRQNRRLPRAFGTLLQVAAGGALALTLTSGVSVANGTYVAALMVGIASAYAAQILHDSKTRLADYESGLSSALFLWGVLWWCIGGFSELEHHIEKPLMLASMLAFATITAILCGEFARKFRMRIALLPAFALLPAMLGFALWAAASMQHPLAQGGWISWPLAFVGFYFIARRHDGALPEPTTGVPHAVGLWLLAALLSWELAWAITQAVGPAGAWAAIAWAIVPAGLLAALPHVARRISWPVTAHRNAYLLIATAGFGLYLSVWSVATNWLVASPSAPLPYFPLLNPLDVAQALVLFILVRFSLRLRSEKHPTLMNLDQRLPIAGLALLGFIWLNAVVLRTLHQWAGIPYELTAMLQSTLAQTAISIFWALLALTTMLTATRAGLRVLWMTGAALLVVVVAKLFLVDLSRVGTIERIVSFVGVGLLMLILGYFSPLPPAAQESR